MTNVTQLYHKCNTTVTGPCGALVPGAGGTALAGRGGRYTILTLYVHSAYTVPTHFLHCTNAVPTIGTPESLALKDVSDMYEGPQTPGFSRHFPAKVTP
jgi:hypothetical protein